MSQKNTRIRIAKWPFVLADSFLLLIAIFIGYWMEGGDGWKIFWVITLTGLAFVSLAFPFITELAINLKHSQQQNQQERNRLQSKIANLEADFLKAAEALARLAEQSENVTRELSTKTQQLDDQLAGIETERINLEQQQAEVIKKVDAVQSTAKLQNKHDQELADIRKKLDQLAAHLEGNAVEDQPETVIADIQEPEEPPAIAEEEAQDDTSIQEEPEQEQKLIKPRQTHRIFRMYPMFPMLLKSRNQWLPHPQKIRKKMLGMTLLTFPWMKRQYLAKKTKATI